MAGSKRKNAKMVNVIFEVLKVESGISFKKNSKINAISCVQSNKKNRKDEMWPE